MVVAYGAAGAKINWRFRCDEGRPVCMRVRGLWKGFLGYMQGSLADNM